MGRVTNTSQEIMLTLLKLITVTSLISILAVMIVVHPIAIYGIVLGVLYGIALKWFHGKGDWE